MNQIDKTKPYCTCSDSDVISPTGKIKDIHCNYCNKPTYAVWLRGDENYPLGGTTIEAYEIEEESNDQTNSRVGVRV